MATTNPKSAYATTAGHGGEWHQQARKAAAADSGAQLTTNQGVRIADNQNQLKAGTRGPVLLEDFVLR